MKNPSSIKKILITAGPTREFIDPVRFISNPSTGAIGYAIAGIAAKKGKEVILLSGPTYLKPPPNVKIFYFESALDLEKLAGKYFKWADCFISSAAVSDFRPRLKEKEKIKKKNGINSLLLVENPDILKSLAAKKKDKILVGFALETENLLKNALLKLREKNLDLIVANKLSSAHSPFGTARVNAYIIDRRGCKKYDAVNKVKLARIILDRVEQICYSFKHV
ncbi:MAG: phosphopantothenoylcysteine decarboxylase [Candidatus Omnitrophica bacterium]|nr:phosphopantothenoylcysteine decarboxylase [Candidatus Omnitrophota bacterium]